MLEDLEDDGKVDFKTKQANQNLQIDNNNNILC
jgi:hypothetical protein